MTGDFEPSGIEYKPRYADAGFSNMVNCNFPKLGDLDGITYTWQSYADSIAAHPGWFPFSYLNNSYHREADPDNMTDCATTLLLSPGTVQVFYGDETGRPLNDARFNVDSNQAFRSDMNWDSIDSTLLDHFSRLGRIRRAHPAIGSGKQITLDSHTCIRTKEGDTVMIRTKPLAGVPIRVAPYFNDGDVVTELYTKQKATVAGGAVTFPEYLNNIAVISIL
jgi:alpha-amylase